MNEEEKFSSSLPGFVSSADSCDLVTLWFDKFQSLKVKYVLMQKAKISVVSPKCYQYHQNIMSF